MSIILEIKNVYKNFGNTQALKNANIKIYKGQVMGLIGENGAGKSTIIKCITGIYKMDLGSIFLEKQKIIFTNIHDSIKAGIAVVHQELKLVENLSVAENIFLGKLKTKYGFINYHCIYQEAEKILKKLNANFSAKNIVKNLTIAQQQIVEIAKALSLKTKIIILDEPTDALSNKETESLFKVINELKKENISFLYVTHRMQEIHQICDKVSIFRDGQFIEEKNTNNTKIEYMIGKMIGRNLKKQFPQRKKINLKDNNFQFYNLTNKFIKNINFQIKKGEIIGLAGLVGAGRTKFAKTIIAFYKKSNGKIFKNNNEIKIKNIKQAIKHGIYYVTENRKFDGLSIKASIRNNIMDSSWSNFLNIFKFINFPLVKKEIIQKQQKLKIKLDSFKSDVASLSGGNQQKILLSKALITKPSLLILDEPTRGVDVGSRKEIYKIINTLAENKISIIIISSELPEIIGISDKIVVFYEGKISGTITNHKDFTENNIIKLATNTLEKDNYEFKKHY